ncbi:MAG TPA: phytase, partial [Roseiflexaceae bacterium]
MIRQLRLTIALLFLAGVGASLSIRQISHADRASQVVQATAAVSATRETTPVPHTGDAADDPAFWIHPSDPAQSTILGTDKFGGLAVYDLAGNQLQYLADGAMNNVDLRYNFPLGDQPVALVTAGNLANNSLAIYRVDPATRQLVSVAARTITPGLSIYGSCMYHSPLSGTFYVFLDAKNGSVEQWELFATTGGRVDAARVRSFGVGSQVEGCVADDEAQAFFISEEAVGIWRYGAEPGAGVARTQVDTTAVGGHVTSNIEGLAIYYTSSGGGYLIASSQGSDDFAIYRRGDNAYVGTFAIA